MTLSQLQWSHSIEWEDDYKLKIGKDVKGNDCDFISKYCPGIKYTD
jgi:hypothetical protein